MTDEDLRKVIRGLELRICELRKTNRGLREKVNEQWLALEERDNEIARLRQIEPNEALERQVRDQRRALDLTRRELREWRQKVEFFEAQA